MEQSGIQFTKSSGGANIAYRTYGSGPPLVLLHNFSISHVELDGNVAALRRVYEDLADHHELIRLDQRGSGLSAASAMPTPQEVVDDVLAVTAALGHEKFDMIAVQSLTPIGIELAASGHVNRLVLCDPLTSVPDAEELTRYMRSWAALQDLGTQDLFTQFWTDLVDDDDREPMKTLFETNVRSHSHLNTGLDAWDARPLLERVASPTLILYTPEGRLTSVDQARQAASLIPDAELVPVEGFGTPYLADTATVLSHLRRFLVVGEPVDASPPDTSVIVFTDVVASTEVVDRHGDESARNAVRQVEDVVVEAADLHGGSLVKHLGDGSLLEFSSASSAVEFARKVQRTLSGGEISVRIGMAAGEPIREAGDIHGAVVVVASRVTDLAGAGEVFVSGGARQLLLGKQHEFEDRGEHTLKGFEEAVRVWRLRMDEN